MSVEFLSVNDNRSVNGFVAWFRSAAGRAKHGRSGNWTAQLLRISDFEPDQSLTPDRLESDPISDRKTRRVAIIVTIVFWLSNYVILTLRNVIDGHELVVELAMVRAALAIFGIGLCYLIHLALKWSGPRSFGKKVAIVAVLTAVAADVYSWASYFGLVIIRPGPPPPIDPGDAIFNIAFWMWFFFAWSAVYLALTYSSEVNAQQRRWAALQSLAHAAQLRALHYQVNPHFLFNTLNSISSLILDRRNEQADAMVGKLSSFFRASLSTDPLDDIALEDEIALQKAYLEIEQVRFPDLSIAIDLPDELRRASVPTLILQPLVENAIKYAVSASDAPANIRIHASSSDDRLRLEVIDDGQATSISPGTGVGLRNVRERLEHRYGADGWFEAGAVLPHGFRVGLEFPLEWAS